VEACSAVDTGTGPQHGCHQLGMGGNATDCFDDGSECIDVCREPAMTP
jgi:hypothetical protein